MYAGCFVEIGPAERVLTQPEHPYTKSLLEAAPELPAALGNGPGG
jgi:peptide/nickel transport system ATP-binding protein